MVTTRSSSKKVKDLTIGDIPKDVLLSDTSVKYIPALKESMTFSEYVRMEFSAILSAVETQNAKKVHDLLEQYASELSPKWFSAIVDVIQYLDDIKKGEMGKDKKKLDLSWIDVPQETPSQPVSSTQTSTSFQLLPPIQATVNPLPTVSAISTIDPFIPISQSIDTPIISFTPLPPLLPSIPEVSPSFSGQSSFSIETSNQIISDLLRHQELEQRKNRELMEVKPKPTESTMDLDSQVSAFMDYLRLTPEDIWTGVSEGLFSSESRTESHMETVSFKANLWRADFSLLARQLQSLTNFYLRLNSPLRSLLQLTATNLIAAHLSPSQSFSKMAIPREILQNSYDNMKNLFRNGNRLPFIVLTTMVHLSHYISEHHDVFVKRVRAILTEINRNNMVFTQRSLDHVRNKKGHITVGSIDSGFKDMSDDIIVKAYFESLNDLKFFVQEAKNLSFKSDYIESLSEHGLENIISVCLAPILRNALSLSVNDFSTSLISVTAFNDLKQIIDNSSHLLGGVKIVLKACLAAYTSSTLFDLAESIQGSMKQVAKLFENTLSTIKNIGDVPEMTDYIKDILIFAGVLVQDTTDRVETTKKVLEVMISQIVDPIDILFIYLTIGRRILSYMDYSPSKSNYNTGDKAEMQSAAVNLFCSSLMESMAGQLHYINSVIEIVQGITDDKLKRFAQKLVETHVGTSIIARSHKNASLQKLTSQVFERIKYISRDMFNLSFLFESVNPAPEYVIQLIHGRTIVPILKDDKLQKMVDAPESLGYDQELNKYIESVNNTKPGEGASMIAMRNFLFYLGWLKSGKVKAAAVEQMEKFHSANPDDKKTAYHGAIAAWLGYDASLLLKKVHESQPVSQVNRNYAIDYALLFVDTTATYNVDISKKPETLVQNISELSDQVSRQMGDSKFSCRMGLENALGKRWHANILLYSKIEAPWEPIFWCICVLLCSTRTSRTRVQAGMKDLLNALQSISRLDQQRAALAKIVVKMEEKSNVNHVDATITPEHKSVPCSADFLPFVLEPTNIVARTAESFMLVPHNNLIETIEKFKVHGSAIVRAEIDIASTLILRQISAHSVLSLGKKGGNATTNPEKVEKARKKISAYTMAEILARKTVLVQYIFARPDTFADLLSGPKLEGLYKALESLFKSVLALKLSLDAPLEITISNAKYTIETVAIKGKKMPETLHEMIQSGHPSSVAIFSKEIENLIGGKLPDTIKDMDTKQSTLKLSVSGPFSLANSPAAIDIDNTFNGEKRKSTYHLSDGGGYHTKVTNSVGQLVSAMLKNTDLTKVIDDGEDFTIGHTTYKKDTKEHEEHLLGYVIATLDAITDQIRKYITDDLIQEIVNHLYEKRKAIILQLETIDFGELLDFSKVYEKVMNQYPDTQPETVWKYLPEHIKKKYHIPKSMHGTFSPSSSQKTLEMNVQSNAESNRHISPSSTTVESTVSISVSESLKDALTTNINMEAPLSEPSQTKASISSNSEAQHKDIADDSPRIWQKQIPKKKFASFSPVIVDK